MMQDQQATFDYEFFNALGDLEQNFLNENPGADLKDVKFADTRKSFMDLARRRVRQSVYQDTLRDLLASGVGGISRRQADPFGAENLPSVPPSNLGAVANTQFPNASEDDTYGEFIADPSSDAHEFAVLRQNSYEAGRPLRFWDEYLRDKPSKIEAMSNGFIAQATAALEGAAEGVGRYVGSIGMDMAFPQYEYAKKLGVSRDRLDSIVQRASGQMDMRGRSDPLGDEDRRIYDAYMQMRQPMMESMRDELGKTGRSYARYATDTLLPGFVEAERNRVIGSDPNNPRDIREKVGRAGGGVAVGLAEMTGSAVGILPYSVPALATRNPRLAFLLTTPFYAMGHSESWDRRMRIYEEQLDEARSAGLPEPPRPSFLELQSQAKKAGAIEMGSEYTIDRLQVALPRLGKALSRKLPNAGGATAEATDKAATALLESMSRRRGPLGMLKSAAVVGAAGATEAVEEAIPQLGKELTDPFYIPEGYESDFFSAETAEAMGTGFIAGLLMGGGQATFGTEARKRRRERKRFRAAVDQATSTVAGAISDKASRVAKERFAANAIVARGPTMASSQVDELAAGDRLAMFVSPDNVDATLTDDVRLKMEQVGISTKPIGQINGMNVYAMPAFAAEVGQYAAAGEIGKITGNGAMMQPGLMMAGAIVVRNKANQVVDVVPFSSTTDGEAALPSFIARASKFGGTARIQAGDSMADLSQEIESQVDADSVIRGITPPSRRPMSEGSKMRGMEALRLDIAIPARGNKGSGSPDDQFASPLLSESEIAGAKKSDVEVEVVLSEVSPDALTDSERKAGTSTGVTPTVLDAKVVYRITRPDGKVEVIEKDPPTNGVYLGQTSPDGLFLLRSNGNAMTLRNAVVVGLHELRHYMVGQSRGAAEYMAKLLYLDPEFAMRGGLEYMRYYEMMMDRGDGSGQAGYISTLDDASLLAYYAGMHQAALSVLNDTEGYAEAMRVKADPSSSPEQLDVADKRIAEQRQAERERESVERFAEETIASTSERTIGQVASRGISWETEFKNSSEMSMRKFVAWFSNVLAKNGFAGPEARQAVYEAQQRLANVPNDELAIFRQMRDEVQKKYEDDLRKHRELVDATTPQPPVQQPMAAQQTQASAPAQPAQAQVQQQTPQSPSYSLRAPQRQAIGVATPSMDEDEAIRKANDAIASAMSLPPGERASAVANIASALTSLIPIITGTQASIASTGTRGGNIPGLRFPQGVPQTDARAARAIPPSEPEQPSATASMERAPLREPNEAETEIMDRERSRPMLSLNPSFYSAMRREIDKFSDKPMRAADVMSRFRGLMANGAIKKSEFEWSGLEEYLALHGDNKVSKSDLVEVFVDRGAFVKRLNNIPTQYGSYTLPGGSAYMETLLTIPTRTYTLNAPSPDVVSEYRKSWDEFTAKIKERREEYDRLQIDRSDDIQERMARARRRQELLKETRDLEDERSQVATQIYTPITTAPRFISSHFDTPNVVAHVRSTQREADFGSGKAKTLFIEEMQSDWAQAGRKRGFMDIEAQTALQKNVNDAKRKQQSLYRDARVALAKLEFLGFDTMVEAVGYLSSEGSVRQTLIDLENRPAGSELPEEDIQAIAKYVAAWEDRARIEREYKDSSKGIEVAPFVTSTDAWLTLSLKEAILEAIDANAGSVTFVSGDQSVARYQEALTKAVDNVVIEETSPGRFQYSAYKQNEAGVEVRVAENSNASRDEVLEMFGEVAGQQLIDAALAESAKPEDQRALASVKGSELRVGGDGMRRFYDQIVPAAANKLLRKLGGDKVREATVNLGYRRNGERIDGKQIGFEITPAMRENIASAGGLSMFSLTPRRGQFGAGSKAVDQSGALTTVYNGDPNGFMRFDSDRMGQTERPVEMGAATSASFQDGLWFTDSRSSAMRSAGLVGELGMGRVDLGESISSAINGRTNRLARSLPKRLLDLYEQRSGSALSEYQVTPELLLDDSGRSYEDAIANHRSFLSEMMDNDPVAVAAIDQAFRAEDIIGSAQGATGSRGAVTSANLDIQNPVVREVNRDEPFATQAEDAISEMNSGGNDGVIFRMPDGEQRYFVTRPSQVAEIGRGRDISESSMLSLNTKSMNGNIKDMVELAKSRKFQTIRDFKVEMQDAVRAFASQNGIDLSSDSDQEIARVVALGTADAVAALKEQSNAIGWYDIKTRVAMRIMSLVHPKLATDPAHRFAFIYALAVTSNGMKVNRNFVIANKAYTTWVKTRKMPTDVGEGTAKKAINAAMATYNDIAESWDMDDFRKFMLTKFTVQEIGRLSEDLKPGGEKPDTVVRGAAILGPKIGNGFFSNLYGIFDALTMDRWLVRTMGRWTGDLVNVDPAQVASATARLETAMRSLGKSEMQVVSEMFGGDVPAGTEELANAIANKMNSEENRELFASGGLNEVRLAAKQLVEKIDGSKEAPENGEERNKIRRIFSEILSNVQADPQYSDLTMADLQAVLWYAEKRLYDGAKVDSQVKKTEGYEDTEAPDYANAAAEVALENGVSQRAIDKATKEEYDRTGNAGSTAGGSSPQSIVAATRSATPQGFSASEKRSFSGSQIARRVAAKRGTGAKGSWTYKSSGIPGRSSRRNRNVNVAGSPRSVTVIREWNPAAFLKQTYEAMGHTVPKYLEIQRDADNAAVFVDAMVNANASNGAFGAAVEVKNPSDYLTTRMFLSEDGLSGFALRPDGDIISLFSNSSMIDPATGLKESRRRSAVDLAVDAGGIKLDCFDTVLPNFYRDHGFYEVSRLKWDDSQAPIGWNKSSFSKFNNGEPDLVFMVLDPTGTIGRSTTAKRSRSYSGAVRAQNQAVGEMHPAYPSSTAPMQAMFSMRRGLPGVRDEAVLRYVDKYDELRRYVEDAQAAGIAIPDVSNPYIGARLLSGVLGALQQAATRRYADILRRMSVAGISLEQMDSFLTAQHAQERNEYIATINTRFPDGGSGMTTSDANTILNRHRAAGTFAQMEAFADEWREMLRESLLERRNAGLISQETYDNINNRYDYYVPLRGAPAQVNDEDFLNYGDQGGAGLSTSGRGMPSAMGRRSAALGVTSQIGYVHEDAFRRIEKNRIGQSFLELVLAVNDINMAQVVRPTRNRIVPIYAAAPGGGRIRTGENVRPMHDSMWMSNPRNFGLYVNRPMTIGGHNYEPGDLVVIQINNRRLAEAMTQPALELRSFERGLRYVNNAWRFMTTGMGNPTFAPVNLVRDLLTANLNNFANRGVRDTYGMMSRWGSSFANVFSDAWAGRAPTGAYGRFVQAGGDQVYWNTNDLEVKRTDFTALADRVARRDPNDRGLARALFGWYPAFFAAAETASRVAQYEQRIASGDTPQAAALAARDITVDFAKGGQAKPVLNTWYMFLNAGLQGSVNVLSSLSRSITLAPSLLMLGFVNAAMARFMGGDDEETAQSRWDNIPEYERSTNLFFFDPSGSGRYIKVPLPYGYNVLVSIGGRMADSIYGRTTVGDVISGAVNDSLNSFNPIGGSGIRQGGTALAAAAVPTMIRPAVELLGNEDFSGRAIFPRSFTRFPGPDSALSFDGTPAAYTDLAEYMNRLTGGDDYESGMVDMSPNTMQYLVGYYLSGTGRLMDRMVKLATDPEATVRDIPIARSFVGDASQDTRSLSQNYYTIMERNAPNMRRVQAAMDDSIPLDERREIAGGLTSQEIAMVQSLEQSEKTLALLRRMLRTATPEQRDAILDVRRKTMKSTIAESNRLTDLFRDVE